MTKKNFVTFWFSLFHFNFKLCFTGKKYCTTYVWNMLLRHFNLNWKNIIQNSIFKDVFDDLMNIPLMVCLFSLRRLFSLINVFYFLAKSYIMMRNITPMSENYFYVKVCNYTQKNMVHFYLFYSNICQFKKIKTFSISSLFLAYWKTSWSYYQNLTTFLVTIFLWYKYVTFQWNVQFC